MLAAAVGLGLVGVIVLFAVIITIRHPDGKETVVRVPDGSNVAVSKDGQIEVKLPADAPPPAIAPFDAKKAKEHQEAWAKHLGVPVEQTNSIGMKFVLIPPGEFDMGSTDEEIAAEIERAKKVDVRRNSCIESPPKVLAIG